MSDFYKTAKVTSEYVEPQVRTRIESFLRYTCLAFIIISIIVFIDRIYRLERAFNSSADATFIGYDRTTQGNWKSNYGSLESNLLQNISQRNIDDRFKDFAVSIKQGQPAVWNIHTDDIRVLENLHWWNKRSASCITADTIQLRILEMTSKTHRWSFYFLDYDRIGRKLSVEIRNISDGKLVDQQTIDNFAEGVYLTWDIKGSFDVIIKATQGLNPVLSAWFVDESAQ